MAVSSSYSSETTIPTVDEKALATSGYRILKAYSEPEQPHYTFYVDSNPLPGDTVTIPAQAMGLLIEILKEMSQGKAVRITAIKQELTTSEAADLLNVSRPYLVGLLESGEIPFRKVGARRRVLFQDVMAYKNRIDTQREQTLAGLAQQAQELGMGYE